MAFLILAFILLVPLSALAANCSSLDLTKCGQMVATPIQPPPTEATCGGPCSIIQCCEWEDLDNPTDLGYVLSTALNPGGFGLKLGKVKLPRVRVDVSLDANFPLENQINKLVNDAKSITDQDVWQAMEDFYSNVLIPAIPDPAKAPLVLGCTVVGAAGYVSMANSYGGQVRSTDRVDPATIASIDCFYSHDAPQRARLHFGIGIAPGNAAQTFGDDVYFSSKWDNYAHLMSTEEGRTLLFHELNHVDDNADEDGLLMREHLYHGTKYFYEWCKKVFLEGQSPTPGGQAYENNPYEVRAYAKADEVAAGVCGSNAQQYANPKYKRGVVPESVSCRIFCTSIAFQGQSFPGCAYGIDTKTGQRFSCSVGSPGGTDFQCRCSDFALTGTLGATVTFKPDVIIPLFHNTTGCAGTTITTADIFEDLPPDAVVTVAPPLPEFYGPGTYTLTVTYQGNSAPVSLTILPCPCIPAPLMLRTFGCNRIDDDCDGVVSACTSYGESHSMLLIAYHTGSLTQIS